MSLYAIMKDFAGPIATVVAAGTAAWIAFRIGQQQIKISRSVADINATQANIALQKLKFELFDKKYGIFNATQTALLYCIQHDTEEIFRFSEISNFVVKLEESELFFSRDVSLFCDQVRKGIDQWSMQRRVIRRPDPYGGSVMELQLTDDYINSCEYLQSLLNETFRVFAPELMQNVNIDVIAT